MWLDPGHSMWRKLVMIGILVSGLLLALASTVDGAGAKATRPSAPEAVASDTSVITPLVRDTPANLQAAFDNEVNAKERYLAFAKQAEAEGYLAVAILFRACAKAESVHARRHVEAIAASGGQARAVLERLVVGSTAENLKAALYTEKYEVDRWYPALLAQARRENLPAAVRSLTAARSAEREHARLLSDALAMLESRPSPVPLFVCSYCGKTVPVRPRLKCPNCFTAASRFLRVPESGESIGTTPAGQGADEPAGAARPGTRSRSKSL